MFQFKTLRNKPVITGQDGEQTLDLSAPTWEFSYIVNVTGSTIVPEEMAMRPDLVSTTLYGDMNKVDYVTKLNGISNPFSLMPGQLILAGEPGEIAEAMQMAKDKNDADERIDLRSKLFDPTKLSRKDVKRLEYIQQKSKAADEASMPASNLPPNFAEIGRDEITVKDGKVVFGDNVVSNKADCPEPLSRARVKAKLLEAKIFRSNII